MNEEQPTTKLMDKVIGSIALCYDYPDDSIPVQVIKVFLVTCKHNFL